MLWEINKQTNRPTSKVGHAVLDKQTNKQTNK